MDTDIAKQIYNPIPLPNLHEQSKLTNHDTDKDQDTDDDDKPKQIKLGVCKFKNIGGITCYINSILHILQQIPIFAGYISQIKFKESILKKINNKVKKNPDINPDEEIRNYVIFELFRLFKISFENDDSAITPNTFKILIGKKNDMWNEFNHQDSQEFFTFLISQLEEEAGVKSRFIPGFIFKEFTHMTIDQSLRTIISTDSFCRFQSREFSPIKYMFDGLIENNRRCMCCQSSVVRYEPYLTLPLAIPIKNKDDILKTFTIYDSLNHMILEEQFDDDNKMVCEMCGLKNKSFCKTLIWKSPKILVLHIKRFLVNSFGMPTQKLTNNILYPYKDFDLSTYFNPASPFKNQSKYDLIGVNIHQAFGFGGNVNSGHYTSLCKNIFNNKWYLFNDSHDVKMPLFESHLQNSNAYLLFYYRHD